MNPYKMQQRCAPSFHKGKVILAADAAHVCNPFGGLGLTGGIADVGSLYDCLLGIHKGLADDSIIEKYSQVRMQIYKDVIDPMSRDNFRRISQQDPDTAGEKDEFFQLCKKAASDEEFSKELCMVRLVFDIFRSSLLTLSTQGLNVLTHDFTQYWQKQTHTVAPQLDDATVKHAVHIEEKAVDGGVMA